jgi:cytochrome oxidase Cu insertion factor (SCO1/SenC/PrrC family)
MTNPSSHARRIAAVLSLLASCAAASAQESAPASRPSPFDGAQVMREMIDAVAAADVISFKVRTTQKGGGDVVTYGDAEVVLARGADPEKDELQLRLKGLLAAPGRVRFDAARVGDLFRGVDLDGRVYEDEPWFSERGFGEMRLTHVRNLVPLMFVMPAFVELHENDTATLDGTETVDGVLCDAVLVERKSQIQASNPDGSTRMASGKSTSRYVAARIDRLPRRIVQRFPSAFGPLGRFESLHELETLVVRPPDAAKSFALPIPDGCKRGKFGGAALEASFDPFREGSKPAPKLPPKVGDQVSDFTVRDFAGKEFALAKQRAKTVVVRFAEGVRPFDLKRGEDLMGRLRSRLGDKVAVVEMLQTADPQEIADAKKRSVLFPRSAEGKKVAEAWGVIETPALYVVSPEGKVLAVLQAAGESKDLADEIDRIAKERLKSASAPKKS